MLSYTYDAWGNATVSGNTSLPANKNPFRYRGYYYDADLDLYYLNSRYYDSNTGRFINADGYVSTGQGLIGNNMFAYCNNNPVMNIDPTGELLISGAAVCGILYGLGVALVGTAAVVGVAIVITEAITETIELVEDIVNVVEVAVAANSIDDTKEDTVTGVPPQIGTTYYHITTPEAAASIMASGIMVGSKWEGGYVYAWKTKPNKYAMSNSGAHTGVVISFKTNAVFFDDTGIKNPKVKKYLPVATEGPIVVWDVKIVG